MNFVSTGAFERVSNIFPKQNFNHCPTTLKNSANPNPTKYFNTSIHVTLEPQLGFNSLKHQDGRNMLLYNTCINLESCTLCQVTCETGQNRGRSEYLRT